MAEGIEIVIGPRQIREAAYIIVIITLAVLLIIKWGGGSCTTGEDEAGEVMLAGAGLNDTNETANATQEENLCTNDKKDQDETDVDCGGSKCDPCGKFEECHEDSDCETGFCKAWKCAKATCDDGIKNQGETNIDCGGPCKDSKGEFYYDNECHKEVEPSYSGRVDLSILEVETSVNEFEGNENAKIDSVKFKVENGKSQDLIMTAYIYARDRAGSAYFMRSVDDEEVPLATVDIPLLSQGESHTETVAVGTEGKGRTLPETEPDEEYRVVIELRDDDTEKLVNEATWTNK